jgi:anti-sigma factor RsiW
MSKSESCEAIEPLLAPYGESEAVSALTAADLQRVEGHLAACPVCRARSEACRAARAALRSRAAELTTQAPARLAMRCRAAASATSAPRRAVRWAGWSAVGAAAAAVLFVFLMPTRAVATQLALDHMKCAKFAANAVMTGTPAELERAWFDKRRHQVGIPGGNSADGLSLAGLRRCVSTEGNMAHVMYHRQGLPVSLFIFDADRHAASSELETIGHKAIRWTAGANTYVLVGRGQDLSGTATWMQRELTK